MSYGYNCYYLYTPTDGMDPTDMYADPLLDADMNLLVSSPCIDAGDWSSDYSREPAPNFGRINIGAYGNTAQASRSGWNIPGDTNGDCTVNVLDMIFLRGRIGQEPSAGENWKSDVNEDDTINVLDMIFVRNHLGARCGQ